MTEIDKMLVCSTGCIKQETCQRGTDGELPILTIPYREGIICWVDEDFPHPNEDYPDLSAVLAYARAHGCQWVKFDCDADTIDGLPSYDW